jgi:hypothetical protein
LFLNSSVYHYLDVSRCSRNISWGLLDDGVYWCCLDASTTGMGGVSPRTSWCLRGCEVFLPHAGSTPLHYLHGPQHLLKCHRLQQTRLHTPDAMETSHRPSVPKIKWWLYLSQLKSLFSSVRKENIVAVFYFVLHTERL